MICSLTFVKIKYFFVKLTNLLIDLLKAKNCFYVEVKTLEKINLFVHHIIDLSIREQKKKS